MSKVELLLDLVPAFFLDLLYHSANDAERREGIDKHIFQFLLNIYIRDDAGFECQDAFI